MLKVCSHLLLIITCCFLGFSNASAQQAWTSCNGPAGGNITGIDTFASYLWVSTYEGGVYRSSNNGQSWQPYNNGISFPDGETFTSLISSGGKLFLGSGYQGVKMLSSANGTWTQSSSYLTYGFCKQGSALFSFPAYSVGVQKSNDNGATWQPASTGLPANSPLGMAAAGNYVLAAYWDNNGSAIIYRSADGGNTWTLATSPGMSNNYRFCYLRVIGNKIFAGYDSNGGVGRLLTYTTDGGLTWNTVPNTTSSTTTDLIYVNGAYRGTGTGWLMTYPAAGPPAFMNLTASPLLSFQISCEKFFQLGNNIFITTKADGLLKTDTLFSTVQFSNNGLLAAPVPFIDGKGSRVLSKPYHAIGFASSLDNGQSWLRDSTPSTGSMEGASGSAQKGNLWYISAINDGVILSADNGQSWKYANTGFPSYANNTSNMYPQVTSIAVTPSGDVFAGDNGDLYMAQHDTAWMLKHSFPNDGHGNPAINAIAAGGNYLFLNTNDQGQGLGELYRSADNGATWQTISRQGAYHQVMAMTISGNRLITSCTDSCVFISTDWGNTWTRTVAGIATNAGILYGFNSFQTFGNKVFGIQGGNHDLYMLDAGSNTWVNLTPLPTDPQVLSVWSSGDTVLYAGTVSNGVWKKRTIPSPTSVGWEPAINGLQATLYPNPSDQPFLSLNGDYKLPATICLYEAATGKRCAQQSVPKQRTAIDGNALPAGIYLLDVRDAQGKTVRLRWLKTH